MARKIKSFYLASLLLAPIVVCLVEASQIEYPHINPFLGTPENPWLEFVRFSFSLGHFLATISFGLTLLETREFKEGKLRFVLLTSFSIINILFIWVVLGLAQQTAIYKYLALINANGLHSLGRYPFIFLENFSSAWSYYLYVSIGLLESIFTIYSVRNSQKPISSFS